MLKIIAILLLVKLIWPEKRISRVIDYVLRVLMRTAFIAMVLLLIAVFLLIRILL